LAPRAVEWVGVRRGRLRVQNGDSEIRGARRQFVRLAHDDIGNCVHRTFSCVRNIDIGLPSRRIARTRLPQGADALS